MPGGSRPLGSSHSPIAAGCCRPAPIRDDAAFREPGAAVVYLSELVVKPGIGEDEAHVLARELTDALTKRTYKL
jgi:hypothetical protein